MWYCNYNDHTAPLFMIIQMLKEYTRSILTDSLSEVFIAKYNFLLLKLSQNWGKFSSFALQKFNTKNKLAISKNHITFIDPFLSNFVQPKISDQDIF